MMLTTKALVVLSAICTSLPGSLTVPVTDIEISGNALVQRMPGPSPGDGNNGGDGDCGGDASDVFPVLVSDPSQDGIKTGNDPKGVPYALECMDKIRSEIPDYQQQLDGEGKMTYIFKEAFSDDWMGSGPDYMLKAYRASSALGRTALEAESDGEIFIHLDGTVGRNIFDPIDWSENPQGIGQVWRQAEQPTIMRNPNVKKITAVWQDPQSKNWIRQVQWDVNDPNARPRDAIPIISFDDKEDVPQTELSS